MKMNNVCAKGLVTNGYDVSHWQPNLNVHAQMAARGDKFCLIKCTEGIYHDQMFKAHWNAAKAAGMMTGAYNFFHPSVDSIQQAKALESIVGKFGPLDLGAVIDWETTDGVPAIRDSEDGLQFLEDVEAATGKTPIIYGSPYFLKDLAMDSRFKKYGLWVAHYGAKCPLVPPPFDTWLMWQYTSAGGQDLNLFNGDAADLELFCGKSVVSP